MSAKHEPPSSTSFYVSLATATLRAGLVVAALVVGVFILSRAFPEAPARTSGGGAPPPSPMVSPTTPPPEETTSPPPSPPPSPEVQGVRLAVLNGTSETGLAASTAQRLKDLGYRIASENIGNATGTYETTTLFFRGNSRLEARHLRDTVFNGAQLERATGQLDPEVQITVVLGQDWADQCC